jgi:uncharacterized protein (TIGR00299 family) protein
MKIAFFDCFSGASGDMILGALMDAGLGLKQLQGQLAKLHLTHYDVQLKKVLKQGLMGSQALVSIDSEENQQPRRHLSHIREIIENSDLSESVKHKSIKIFTRLAKAEAKVHQTSIENIHFHEVGAVDAIIDVVGAVVGLDLLHIESVFCSPLQVGSGTVECAHGTLPVPAPATVELIKGIPIYSTGIEGELLTPTGAAVLTSLSSGFGPMPAMTTEKVGYGAGTSEHTIPNLLRVIIGEMRKDLNSYEIEQVAVVETSIDDMNPQIYEYLIQNMLKMGVLDVFLSPLQMKKNRPGTLVTVICSPNMVNEVSNYLMQETTSIGLRWRVDNRIKANRYIKEVQTPYGIIRFKVAQAGDKIINVSPEYEDCKRVAREKKLPLKVVMEAARAAASDTDAD